MKSDLLTTPSPSTSSGFLMLSMDDARWVRDCRFGFSCDIRTDVACLDSVGSSALLRARSEHLDDVRAPSGRQWTQSAAFCRA